MKALKFFGRDDVRLVDVPEPTPGPGEVKIRVKYCGFCGTDLSEFKKGPVVVPTRPHHVTGKMAPDITLGHEFSGDVSELGPGVEGFNVGDRVAVRPTICCYTCYFCRAGKVMHCRQRAVIGTSRDGAFAEYVLAPVDCVFKFPAGIDYKAVALCEPLAVSLHGVNTAQIRLDSTVAIIGAGPIGLMALQEVILSGAKSVFVIDPLAQRRQIARELGATAVYDPAVGDPGKEIDKLTGGLRADVTMEIAGVPSAMLLAPKVTARGGRIVQLGLMMDTCDAFPFMLTFSRTQSIIPSFEYVNNEFPAALDLLVRKKINTDPLITKIISLNDIVEKGFKALTGPEKAEHIKVLVSPE